VSTSKTFPPIKIAAGTLEVRRKAEGTYSGTHSLVLVTAHEREEITLATHPNGHSCHALAKRMAAGDDDKVTEQAEYITRCGGKVLPTKEILPYVGIEKP
jgi:hypothetical protein